MNRIFLNLLFLFLSISQICARPALSLDSSNFDSTLSENNVLVKFFAPWCGHCKKLAPEYEKVVDAFSASKKVVIAEVDCDANSGLCGANSIDGYPTLKFFEKGNPTPKEYEDEPTAEGLIQFVESQGIRAKKVSSPVVSVTPTNFEKIVLNENKDILVKFFAPWCGHCKELAPHFIEVASAFANEPVVLAEVDCDAHSTLCQQYGVSGYPTLTWFPKTDKTGIPYNGERTTQALVTFLNEKIHAFRTPSGGLMEQAGRVEILDSRLGEFMQATDKLAMITLLREAVSASGNEADVKAGKTYFKIMEAIAEKGPDFVHTETTRIQQILADGSMSSSKVDDFVMKLNVLKQFSKSV